MSSLLFLVSACTSQKLGQKEMGDFTVALTAQSTQFKLGQPISLTFSVSTIGSKEGKFCRYMTTAEGFNGNILIVTNSSGEKFGYTGIMKKRGKPGPDDFIHLKASESKSFSFELETVYPITQVGSYTVQFKGNKSMNNLPDSNVLKVDITAP